MQRWTFGLGFAMTVMVAIVLILARQIGFSGDYMIMVSVICGLSLIISLGMTIAGLVMENGKT